jgi:CheY-like chemotaxis protein
MIEPSAVPAAGEPRSRRFLPFGTLAGLFVATLAVGLIAFFSSQALRSREEAANRVTHTLQVIQHLQSVLSLAKDAETGQRGYMLSGEERYLAPHTNATAALPDELAALARLVADDPAQVERVDVLRRLAEAKLKELQETIDLRAAGETDRALALVRTDRGQGTMERIRDLVSQMEAEERSLLEARQAEWQAAVSLSSHVTWGGLNVLVVLIVIAGFMMARDYRARETQIWLRTGQMAMATRVQGEQRLEALGANALELLTRYLDAQAGALYLAQPDGFRRVAAHAAPVDGAILRPGDGLLGQAARDRRPLHVRDVPAGYLPVSSALGSARATELLIAPAAVDGIVQAVVELAFFRRVRPEEADLLDRVSQSLGVAVRASKDRTRLEELLEETQRQSEELQSQQEELRVSNEELEEQSRVLRESRSRLESQQAELEQINSQLEEQTQLLEAQKEDLAQAQVVLTDRAEELERANQYKSEFLANMSHELRTPLNSSLILAKLLADNKDGNLSDEQVRFAQTIYSAGRDLLDLINDILDLSRIEAGRMELSPEPVPLPRVVEGLVESLTPMAAQKGLAFTAAVEAGAPERIQTDPQRLGQILKNLLSNAIKFTEAGGVSLRVSAAGDGFVAFAVRDTGIGIPAHQQAIIFEAFRQADGSTHRKYGGTGLGLSISRDLARLLGGDIAVTSTPGTGSAFTLTLPVAYAPAPSPRLGAPALAPDPAPSVLGPALARPQVPDDRDRLTADATRRILVIEDDVAFAGILRDLAHERGFQCLVAHSAGDGLAAAGTFRPSAIVLDMNLPDGSGLGVLDQLKHDPRTRHVPVHVVSVADYRRQALERGAIGYALKPVQHEELQEAFRRLEAKVVQAVRRVLVVEDDPRQRESVQQLLRSDGVQIEAVETAGEALERLRAVTYDCMVMDLNLPDMSGYDLLARMAEQDDVAFPPVIVYTGRVLTRDEEQSLRRFSKSIIVKDARSPERLLDEVTLFLHQVESTLPIERQRMLRAARHREQALEGRRILVVEDDARNIFALSNVLEPKGAVVEIARNGREALAVLERASAPGGAAVDLVLMDIMMPEMDGLTAMREIRKRPGWAKLPIIALTAKAMKDDQERCLDAGANDYIAKPLDVEQLLSLVRVWMPK